MSCKNNLKLFLFNIDIFGKDPKLYYKGKPKFKTLLGSFSTIIYVVIYILLFIYKLNIMLKKEDVKYYETNVNTEGTPFIELTKKIFYPIFTLGQLGDSEKFYFIYALIWKGKKVNGEWDYDRKVLELEKCKLENFSPKYRESFGDIQKIENYYCIKNINDLFGGNDYSNNYIYFQIFFFPCNNGLNNSTKCDPSNIFEEVLKYNNKIEILFPNVELSPQIYKTPVKFGKRGISFRVSEKLYNELYLNFHKLNIETDVDNLDLSKKIKKESYLTFDSHQIVSSLNKESNSSQSPFASIIIQLSDKIVTVKRTYTKLIDVLGSIGGIMGIIFSFFQIIISFLTDILYNISLVNNLFNIDFEKNNLIFKSVKKNINDINENFDLEEKPKELNLKKELIDESSERKINLNIKKKTKIYLKPIKVYNLEIYDNNNSKKNIKDENKIIDNNNMNKIDDLNKIKSDKENEIEDIKNKENKDNIKELNLTFFGDYFCFCLFRKKKNNQKNILNEAMKIIYEKNDITNLSRILYSFRIEKEKKDK